MNDEIARRSLLHDEWMGRRIDQALDAIRHAENAGLETALDLLAFAEDVIDRFAPGALDKQDNRPDQEVDR